MALEGLWQERVEGLLRVEVVAACAKGDDVAASRAYMRRRAATRARTRKLKFRVYPKLCRRASFRPHPVHDDAATDNARFPTSCPTPDFHSSSQDVHSVRGV